jgi:hypothetical protein
MSNFKTTRHNGRLLFLAFLFGIPLFLFLKIPILFRFFMVLIFIGILFITTNDLELNDNEIIIKFPFLPFVKRKKLLWKDIKVIKVEFRGALTHGAMMPSYIQFVGNKINERINYKLSKEELIALEKLIRLKGVEFVCLNSPYMEYD